MNLRSVLLVGLLLIPATSSIAQDKAARAAIFKSADAIVIAKLDSANSGSIMYSRVPIFNVLLKLVPDHVARGPQKKGDAFSAYHTVQRKEPPEYPVGRMCIVVLQLE